MFELNVKFQSRCKNPRFISMAVARNAQIKRVTNSGNSVWSNKNSFSLREQVCLEFTSICSHSAGRADKGSGEPERYLHVCGAPAWGWDARIRALGLWHVWLCRHSQEPVLHLVSENIFLWTCCYFFPCSYSYSRSPIATRHLISQEHFISHCGNVRSRNVF